VVGSEPGAGGNDGDTRIFIFSFGGVDKYLGGGGGGRGGGAAACFGRAWWQCPERPRKKFNKICFLGLHGEI
jgi:hypothetical protein